MGDKKNRRNIKIKTVLIVLAVLIGIALLLLLLQKTAAFDALGKAIHSIQSLLFGIVFACLISPLVTAFERRLKKRLSTPEKPRTQLVRGISVALGMGILVFIIAAVLVLIIPQVGVTLTQIIPSFSDRIANLNEWIENFSDSPFWHERIFPYISDFMNNLAVWILGYVGVGTETYASLTTGIASGIANMLTILLNAFVGLILAVYLQVHREKLFAQITKLTKAVFRERIGGYIMEGFNEAIRIFTGFFSAKVLEAIIMGVICFGCMLLLQLPYGTLISVIVGIANIIPFFGPWIGAGLGAVIILLVDPWQALVFLIMMAIVVQIDGNIIGPKILGHSTGLSPLWVIVAILLFTGCFGFIGAFIGVPVFAWIYYIVKRLAERSLSKQNLPVDTEFYENELDDFMQRRMKEKAVEAEKKQERKKKTTANAEEEK